MEELTGKALAAALQRPFDPTEELEWKAQSCGKNGRGFWALVVPYIKANAIRDRLDDVVGPENWKTEKFEPGAAGGLQCGLSLRVNGEWITKWDGAENMGDQAGMSIKGGMSDAYKRVARVWGIGRYLARVEVGFGKVVENGTIRCQTKAKERFKCNPPGLPAFCWPENYSAPRHSPKTPLITKNPHHEPADREPPVQEPTFQEVAEKAREAASQPTQETDEDREITRLMEEIGEGIKQVNRRHIKLNIDGHLKSAFIHFNRRMWDAKNDWQKLQDLHAEITNLVAKWDRDNTEWVKAA